MIVAAICNYMKLLQYIVRHFCLGTEVPRHSAGCVGTWYVRGTYVAFRNAPAQVLHACSTPLIGCQTYLLDECRTLWGEPERVHAGTECAWSSCMCMSSECESDEELRTQTQITPEKVMTALIIDFVHLKQSGR